MFHDTTQTGDDLTRQERWGSAAVAIIKACSNGSDLGVTRTRTNNFIYSGDPVVSYDGHGTYNAYWSAYIYSIPAAVFEDYLKKVEDTTGTKDVRDYFNAKLDVEGAFLDITEALPYDTSILAVGNPKSHYGEPEFRLDGKGNVVVIDSSAIYTVPIDIFNDYLNGRR